ncbi:hypothetical protein RRG08_042778 [Elysia crispata]|uniref:Uncharacterized protein n=1 Tax=Elysia crispata TaxID=231223 RepID=A0AAE0XQ74_9GAST|nr:hypothetical protein RRG08_042778 [Elysia crispata]
MEIRREYLKGHKDKMKQKVEEGGRRRLLSSPLTNQLLGPWLLPAACSRCSNTAVTLACSLCHKANNELHAVSDARRMSGWLVCHRALLLNKPRAITDDNNLTRLSMI